MTRSRRKGVITALFGWNVVNIAVGVLVIIMLTVAMIFVLRLYGYIK